MKDYSSTNDSNANVTPDCESVILLFGLTGLPELTPNEIFLNQKIDRLTDLLYEFSGIRDMDVGTPVNAKNEHTGDNIDNSDKKIGDVSNNSDNKNSVVGSNVEGGIKYETVNNSLTINQCPPEIIEFVSKLMNKIYYK